MIQVKLSAAREGSLFGHCNELWDILDDCA